MATSRRGKSKPPDHSERVRTGLTKAKERGVKLGRPAERATSRVRLLPARMGALGGFGTAARRNPRSCIASRS